VNIGVHMKIFLLVATFLLLPSFANADWEATLKSAFPSGIVDTFDNLQDWTGANFYGGKGNHYESETLPKKTDGSPSLWTFYAQWGTTSTSPWIGNFGTGTSVTGKSAIIDIGSANGPNRLGMYFGNGSASSGYSDIYIFYRYKYPQNEWPTHTSGTCGGSGGNDPCGVYQEGEGWTFWWTAWKMNTINMGCTGPNAATQCGSAEPYSDYHIVPHIRQSTINNLKYVLEPTGKTLNASVTTSNIPSRNKWGGVEFHYRNYVSGGQSLTDMDVWDYDERGVATQVMNTVTNDYTGLQPSTDKWNFFFLGGNNTESYGWGPTMHSGYYVDDVIINGSRIGPTYYSLLNGASDTTAPAAPGGLRVR
jgi:hypothetical protein